jgi:hypothetical protein
MLNFEHPEYMVLSDGLGNRRVTADQRWGPVEIRELIAELGTPMAELSIRSAVARLSRSGSVTAPVFAIERHGSAVHVIAGAVEGRRLSEILALLERGAVHLPPEALLELSAMVVTVVRWFHEMPGAPVHGAISPEHLVLRENGQLALTDGIFADALGRLRWGRDRLWRQFHIALPAAANEPVFDHAGDIAGVGAVVLALLLRRPLREAEYPSAVADLIMAATLPLPEWGPAMRDWLQQALPLRTPFSSSAEASSAFSGVLQMATRRREGARALLAEMFSVARTS